MGREATRAVSGGRPSVAEALRVHASVICLQKEWCVYVSVWMCVWRGSHRGTSMSYTVTVETCLRLKLPVEWEV